MQALRHRRRRIWAILFEFVAAFRHEKLVLRRLDASALEDVVRLMDLARPEVARGQEVERLVRVN